MDFRISDDQVALADGIRGLLAARLPIERLRAGEGADPAIRPEDWAALAEAGVFSLTLPEPAGIGAGLADAAVVFEELGRALVPGPLVGTFLAAGAGLVEGAAEGTAQVGVHLAGGEPILVEHLSSLQALLILSGREPGSTARLLSPAPSPDEPAARRIAAPLDPLTPLWQLGSLPAGSPISDAGDALVRQGALLTAALQVGHAAQTLDLAVAHAKERHQFSRPIGSFQAVQHICADMLVRAEVARTAVHAAACQADQPEVADDVVLRATAGAKLLADEAALANARSAIQVHGGMGFTWVVPLHLHLKRSLVLATTFGTAAQLSATLATLA